MSVILYHQEDCPQCKMVVMLLNQKSIKWRPEEDIKVMLDKGITHVPTLEVNGAKMIGKNIIDWINKHE